MPNLIEDRLCELLAAWMNPNRTADLPDTLEILIARRDEIRSRPCVVLNASESKAIPALPHTAKVKLDLLELWISDCGFRIDYWRRCCLVCSHERNSIQSAN